MEKAGADALRYLMSDKANAKSLAIRKALLKGMNHHKR